MSRKEYSKSDLSKILSNERHPTDRELVVGLASQLLQLMLIVETAPQDSSLNRTEHNEVRAYARECWRAQQKVEDRPDMTFELPPLPPFVKKKVKTVMTAYRNMARVWHNSGGCIPYPTNGVIELLHTMGCNGIKFDRRTQKGKETKDASVKNV